jgi:hypothetical protein
MSKPNERQGESAKPDQGIVRDDKGQEQPADSERARRVSRTDRGDDPPGSEGPAEKREKR